MKDTARIPHRESGVDLIASVAAERAARSSVQVDASGGHPLLFLCVPEGIFIEPTQLKPGLTPGSDVKPPRRKAEDTGRSPRFDPGFNKTPSVRTGPAP
jgi:hypothetical protein